MPQIEEMFVLQATVLKFGDLLGDGSWQQYEKFQSNISKIMRARWNYATLTFCFVLMFVQISLSIN